MADREVVNEIKQLSSVLDKLNDGISGLKDGVSELRGDLLDDKKKTKGKDSDKDEKEKLSATGEVFKGALNNIIGSISSIPSILRQQAEAARAFAGSAGISFADAARVQQEGRKGIFEQVKLIAKDLFAGGEPPDYNKMLDLDALQRNVAGFQAAVGGMDSGTRISTDAMMTYVGEAQKQLRAPFEFTPETVRAMGLVGLQTTEDLGAFRESLGLSSLSSQYMTNMINKNTLSFQIYGQSFAKAALHAERLGISLQSATAAATANVMNVENMMDKVNELNAMGFNIDFTEFLRLQETSGLDPQQILNYLRTTGPTGMSLEEVFAKSSSARGTFEGLGYKLDDVLKSGNQALSDANKSLEGAIRDLIKKLGEEGAPTADVSTRTKFGELYKQLYDSAPILTTIGTGLAGFGIFKGLQAGASRLSSFVFGAGKATEAAAKASAAAEAATAARAVPTGLTRVSPLFQTATTSAEAATVAANTAKATTAAAEAGFLARTGAFISRIPGASFLGKIATPLYAGFGAVEGMQAIAADPTAPFMKRFSNYAQGFMSSITFGLIGKSAEEIKAEVDRKEKEENDRIREMSRAARERYLQSVSPQAQALTPPTATTPVVPTSATVDAAAASARVVAKTEELIATLKAMNMPELTNTIKTSEKLVDIRVNGSTVANVGLIGARGRNDLIRV